jgi:hypothetical protein
MSFETRALTIAECDSECHHIGNPCLCRVTEGTPPSIEGVRQFDARPGSPTCHVDEPVRGDSRDVPVEAAPTNIIGANGTQKAQDSLGEAIVSFVPLGAVLAGNKLEEGHIHAQQLLKCRIVARQKALPQRFDAFR